LPIQPDFQPLCVEFDIARQQGVRLCALAVQRGQGIHQRLMAIRGERPEGLPTFEDGVRSALIVDRVIASARTRAWTPIA